MAENSFELRRKLLHMGAGAVVLAPLFFGGEAVRAPLLLLLSLAFLAGVYFVDRKMKGRPTPLFDPLLRLVERPGHPPGYGAFWYGVGLLLLFSFLNSARQIAAGVFILAFADGLASVFGRGGHPLPHNPAKSWEGLATFFIVASLTQLFLPVGEGPLFLAAFAALVESFNLHLDDNITVPLACAVFFRLWGG
ncbi:MAG: hypothetical protein QXH27_03365 [Candidatus Micrarchaeia archaeon]